MLSQSTMKRSRNKAVSIISGNPRVPNVVAMRLNVITTSANLNAEPGVISAIALLPLLHLIVTHNAHLPGLLLSARTCWRSSSNVHCAHESSTFSQFFELGLTTTILHRLSNIFDAPDAQPIHRVFRNRTLNTEDIAIRKGSRWNTVALCTVS